MNFTGTYLALQTAFDNAGVVTAQTDALRSTELLLEGGGTTSGSYTIGVGSELGLYGTQDFTAASTISGAGTVFVDDGVTNAGETPRRHLGTTYLFGTADFTGTVQSVGNSFTIDNGTAIFEMANSPLTLNALVNNSGTLVVDSGILQLLGGGTFNGATTVAAGAELDLADMVMTPTASVDNTGLLNITDSFIVSSGQWTNAAGGVMNFTGTYLALQTAFDNAGAVTAQTDALRSTELLLEGGGTTSGSANICVGSELDLYGTQDFTAASTISGAGTLAQVDTDTFAGVYDITGSTILEGTADFTGTVQSVGRFVHDRIWNGHFRDGEQSADVERGFTARQLQRTLSVRDLGVVQLLGGGTVEDGLITVAAGTELDLTGVLMDSTRS